jgi:hypothetical protein
VTFSRPEFNLKKQMCSSWAFHVDDRSESSSTYVMIIGIIDAQKLYNIGFLRHMGKYKYKRLPMGIKIARFLMFFKMSCLSLFKIRNMSRQPCYLDYLLILTNSSFKDHLLKLEMVLARLSAAGIRVNISKSKFFAEQIEYLVVGYWITRQGI